MPGPAACAIARAGVVLRASFEWAGGGLPVLVFRD